VTSTTEARSPELDVELLALALSNVTADRGYIDLGGMDLAFGGGKPFRDVAEAVAVWYARLASDSTPEQP
jgi:hypothetical protein